jgi:hypothetical protein
MRGPEAAETLSAYDLLVCGLVAFALAACLGRRLGRSSLLLILGAEHVVLLLSLLLRLCVCVCVCVRVGMCVSVGGG